jgi:hypothetical protein
VVLAASEVTESEIITRLTARSFRKALENQATHHAKDPGPPKPLAAFLTPEVLRTIYQHDRALGTNESKLISPAAMYAVPDEILQGMMARYLRPSNHEEFVRLTVGSCERFAPKNHAVEPGPQALIDYHTNLHPVFHNYCEDFFDATRLARLHATEEELRLLPKDYYGKVDRPGTFRIFLAGLGPFTEMYTQALTEDKIKEECPSLSAFITLCQNVNDDFANHSRLHSRVQATVTPIGKVKDIVNESWSKPKIAERDRAQLVGQLRSLQLDSLPTPAPTGLPPYKPFTIPSTTSVAPPRADSPPPPHLMRESETDDSEDEEDDPVTPGRKKRAPIREATPVVDYAREEEQCHIDILYALNGHGQTRDQRPQRPKLSPQDSHSLPCYAQYATGKCLHGNNCAYSHAPAVLQALAARRLEELRNSPYSDKSKLRVLTAVPTASPGST